MTNNMVKNEINATANSDFLFQHYNLPYSIKRNKIYNKTNDLLPNQTHYWRWWGRRDNDDVVATKATTIWIDDFHTRIYSLSFIFSVWVWVCECVQVKCVRAQRKFYCRSTVFKTINDLIQFIVISLLLNYRFWLDYDLYQWVFNALLLLVIMLNSVLLPRRVNNICIFEL